MYYPARSFEGTLSPNLPITILSPQFDQAAFHFKFLPFTIPYPVPFRLLGDERKGWIDNTYMNAGGTFRLARGNKGTLFVLARVGACLLDSTYIQWKQLSSSPHPTTTFTSLAPSLHTLTHPRATPLRNPSGPRGGDPPGDAAARRHRGRRRQPHPVAGRPDADREQDSGAGKVRRGGRDVAAGVVAAGREREPSAGALLTRRVLSLVAATASSTTNQTTNPPTHQRTNPTTQKWGSKQAKSYQVIDAEAGTLENVVDLGLSQIRAQATCSAASDSRTDVNISGAFIKTGPVKVPLPVNGTGFVDWLYLSPAVRVTRGSKGSLFVHVKEEEAA